VGDSAFGESRFAVRPDVFRAPPTVVDDDKRRVSRLDAELTIGHKEAQKAQKFICA
jgi:hypothetical protein